MDFDDQLRRYFGSTDMDAITPAAIPAALEHMKVDFGREQDRDRRFALWTLMYMLGDAPDLDVAFERAEDHEAARDFMDLAGRASGD